MHNQPRAISSRAHAVASHPAVGIQRAALVSSVGLTSLLCILSGCDADRLARRPPNAVRVAIEAPPLTLDPRYSTDAIGSQISELIADGLTYTDTDGQPQPRLARTWQRLDSRTYLFEIQPNLRFADGTPLTTADVKRTFDSLLSAATLSPKRAAFGPLERVEIVDDLRVKFVLTQPFAPFLNATGIGIVKDLPSGADHISRPIGCAPFRLASVTGDSVVLERDPNHAGAGRIERITFDVIPDATTRLLALQRGDLDLVQNAIEPQTLAWLQAQPHLRIQTVPSRTFQYIGMNLRSPPLNDLRVRRALAHAIDRDSLIAGLLAHLARPATGLLPPLHWAYNADVHTYAYDPARARALLDAAGYPDPDGAGPLPRFRLSFKTSTVELRRRIAEALQAQLGDVGVAVDVMSNEWGTFYADIRSGRFDLFSLAWIGISEPDIYFTAFHSTQRPPQGANRGGCEDRVIDRLAAAGRSVSQARRRAQIYRALQRRLSAVLPIVPLWWSLNVAVENQRLHNYELNPAGGWDGLRNAWTEDG